MYSNCCCDYSDDEDSWCNIPRVKGRFGLAFVAETPCCCPEPIGWQVEFCDSPSEVEQACQEMIMWANRPPLPRIEPCPPVEVISPCCPPKCNPYYPIARACCSRYDCGYCQGCSCSQDRNVCRCGNKKRRLRGGGSSNRYDAYDEVPVKETKRKSTNTVDFNLDSSESAHSFSRGETTTFHENVGSKRDDSKKSNKSKKNQHKKELKSTQNYTQTQNTDFQVYHERDFIQLQPPPYQPVEPQENYLTPNSESLQSSSDIDPEMDRFDAKGIEKSQTSPFLYCNQPPPYASEVPSPDLFDQNQKCLSNNLYVTNIPPFNVQCKQFSNFKCKSEQSSVKKSKKDDSKCTSSSTVDEQQEIKSLTSRSSKQEDNVDNSKSKKKSEQSNLNSLKSKHTLSTSRTHQTNNFEIQNLIQSKSKHDVNIEEDIESNKLKNLENISSTDLLTYFRGKNNFESVTSMEGILSEIINAGKLDKISSKESSNSRNKKYSKSSNNDKTKKIHKHREDSKKIRFEEPKDKKDNIYKLTKSCRSPRDYRKCEEAVEIEGFSDADSNNDRKKRWSFDFFRSLTRKLGDIFKNIDSDTDTSDPVIYIDGVRFRVPPNVQKK